MLSYYLMPHPPIIIPDIGKGNENKAINTIKACEEVGKKINQLSPETIIIITPHGTVFKDAIAIITSKTLSGDLRNFNAPNIKFNFEIDTTLTSKIIENATKENIPVVTLDEKTSNLYNIDLELDHGAMVPLYFLKNSKTFKLVHITYGMLSPLELMNFGRCIKNAVNYCNKKAVFIASGDLSHRLTVDGPYPYTPAGKEFDEKLINILQNNNLKDLFTIDKSLIREAGECGLRSLYILAGAINSNNINSTLLSYEGPFGVGYGVMEFKEKCLESNNSSNNNYNDSTQNSSLKDTSEDLYTKIINNKENEHKRRIKEGSIYTRLARKNLDLYFNEGKLVSLDDINDEKLLNDKKGVFVSLKINGDLRGCIGTISPTTDTVAEEIIRNSISAAVNDPRFSPLRKEELKDVDISVDLLYPPEETTFDKLDPKTYGVIVSCGNKRGLLLPNLEGINTAEEQVSIAREKGNIFPNEPYTLQRFKVERFKEIEDGD